MKWINKSLACLALIASVQAYAATQQTSPMVAPTQSPLTAQDSLPDVINVTAQQAGNSFLNHVFNSTDRPGWMTRTDLTYAIQHGTTPVGGIETIQPIYQNFCNTFFWQGRLVYSDGDGTGNVGLGYRYLTNDRRYMLGLNAFYDEEMQYNHQRVGLGGEFFTKYLTFRANYYDAISRTKTTQTSSGGITYYQRALSGYDASIETPVPYVSWVRFVAQAYRWKGAEKASVNGGDINFRMFPARQVEFDAGIAGDNANGAQVFLKLNYYLGSPAFIENSATTPSYQGAYAPVDLEKQRLQKVIRHNDIVVEQTNNGISGSGVTVARGN